MNAEILETIRARSDERWDPGNYKRLRFGVQIPYVCPTVRLSVRPDDTSWVDLAMSVCPMNDEISETIRARSPDERWDLGNSKRWTLRSRKL